MAEEKRRSASPKLAKSEIVTIRLDPKLRYLAELAARKQRRTLSSYIEWAVERSLSDVNVHDGTGYQGDDSISFAAEANRLWDVDEAERFVRLAVYYPDLLTHSEQERWKILKDSKLLLPARGRDRAGNPKWDFALLDDHVFPVLRGIWSELLTVHAEGPKATRDWVRKVREEVEAGLVYNKAVFEVGKRDDDDIPF